MDIDLRPALEQIEREKGISSAEIIEMLESALTSAFNKHAADKSVEYHSKIDAQSGKIKVFVEKIVVKKIENEAREIDKILAMEKDASIKIGDKINVEVPPDRFGRIAAQTAKQIIIQKMRENEKKNLFSEFKNKENQIVSAAIYRTVNNACIVEIGKAEAIMPAREQIRNQRYDIGDIIKVYIIEVEQGHRGPKILVSRTHPGLVKGLFTYEVPEIMDGTIEIMKIVREPGVRCKMAVMSNNLKVDSIGSCVGINGIRVQAVINELGGERIDLIKYSKNIKEYLSNAMSAAVVKEVIILNDQEKTARVIVGDDMLSLAIGKNGQNVRLAARLTGWHIDIQTESQLKNIEKENFKEIYTGLRSLSGIGEKTARLIIESGYDTFAKINKGGINAIASIDGIGEKTAEKILINIKGL